MHVQFPDLENSRFRWIFRCRFRMPHDCFTELAALASELAIYLWWKERNYEAICQESTSLPLSILCALNVLVEVGHLMIFQRILEWCGIQKGSNQGETVLSAQIAICLNGQEGADKIILACCALHNMLLEVDGLDEKWEEGVPSMWEGTLGWLPWCSQCWGAPAWCYCLANVEIDIDALGMCFGEHQPLQVNKLSIADQENLHNKKEGLRKGANLCVDWKQIAIVLLSIKAHSTLCHRISKMWDCFAR